MSLTRFLKINSQETILMISLIMRLDIMSITSNQILTKANKT